MASVIFSGDRLRALRAALQLSSQATIASGAVNPTSVAPGISLSIGSIYLSTSTGKIYQKHTTNGNDTNFYEMQTTDSVITRTKLALGSANHVVINDGTGALSSEAALSNTRGGLGTNASAFSGIVKAASGVFSASTIVNADIAAAAEVDRTKLANGTANHVLINNASGTMSSEAALAASRGGLGTSGAAFTGVVKAASGVFSAATVVNADISATAAIDRTKIANGTANHVIINNASGTLTSEATLAASRGGLGTSAAAFTGVVKAATGVFSASTVVDADVSASAAIARSKFANGSLNRILINNASGTMTDAAAITAARALISDANGIPTHSTVTSTELGYVSGVTSAIQTQLNAKINSTEKGANNGVATLDAGGKVPATQLPNSIMEYKGTWNAATNTPTLANGNPPNLPEDAGHVYICSVGGTVNFGAGPITFAAGDWVVYDGLVWQKSVNSNSVASVNGYTGIVTLTTLDITEDLTNRYFTETRVRSTDLSGFTSSPGNISPADTILSAFQKVDGNNLATQTNVNNLVTLSGVAVDSTSLGSFTGTTIPDNQTVKQALQALETSTEGKANTTLNNLGSTAVNADIIPDTAVTRNLGSNSLLWNTVRAYRVATANTVISFTGNTSSGSGLISSVSSTTGLYVGQAIFGTGIEEGAVIIAINPGVSITIDPVASATNTGVALKASYSGFFRSEDQTTEPSGFALVRSGNTTTAQSGALVLRSGNTTTGKTGDVFFRSGVSSSGGNTGNVFIATGTTSGVRGTISITANAISLDGLGQNINVNSNKIINVVDPTSNQDAATKKYVDDIDAKESSNLTLVASGTISANTTAIHQVIVIQGNAAGTTIISSTPFGTVAPKNGTLITLVGNSSTNLIQINNNNAAKGCIMNGSWVGSQYDSITFAYSSTLDRYIEIARNN